MAITLVLSACSTGTSTTTGTSSSTTGATRPPCTPRAVLASWPLRRLAAQTVAVPVEEDDVAAVTTEVATGAGGVILFGSAAPPDLAQSLAQLVQAAPGGVRPFIMTDEEGGAVQRMANLVGDIPSAREMAATMTPQQIEQLADRTGQAMLRAGVTMDLAPVLDLDGGAGPSATDPDGTRSFSLDPAIATADGLAFAHGLRRAGVIAVVKHFPGLGQASGNTDDGPASTLPWDQLQARGLLPFERAVRDQVPAIMVSNASVPGLTQLPASISPAVITGVLRGQLRFDGLVMTDALSAGALSAAGYSVPAASVDALAAGADMVLFFARGQSAVADLTDQTVSAIAAAVESGAVPRERLIDAVLHIATVKHLELCASS